MAYNVVSKNKLCNIFVVNDTKELSEIRQSWLYTTQLQWYHVKQKFFLHNNYCNIDAISRHLATVGLLCAYVSFFLFHIFFILCTYMYLYAVYHLPSERWVKITIPERRASNLEASAWADPDSDQFSLVSAFQRWLCAPVYSQNTLFNQYINQFQSVTKHNKQRHSGQ